MNGTFYDGHDELYQTITMQSLGKIAQCAPAVGAKMWCFLFVCLFVTLRVMSTVCSRGAQFEQALRCRLLSDFDEVCSIFSEGIVLSDALLSSHIYCQVVPQFSRNCGQKLRTVQKSAEKFVRTTSYRQLRDLKKIPLQLFRAETVDVHRHKKVFHKSIFHNLFHLALTASVEIRIGSPKTARNEQVCAHQKSYRK